MSGIQSNTKIAVDNINENLKVCEQSNKAAESIDEIFKKISGSVLHLCDSIDVISKEISAVVDIKNKLLNVSENLSAISEETRASSEEIYSISTLEISEMENLHAEVESLKDSIITVVKGVEKIKL